WIRIEAADADQALALLEEGNIDVAVIDFNMPGRNGLELGEEIRKQFPKMPVALATANVQDEVIARARAANIAFVSKPITEEGFRGFLSGAVLKLRSARR
ncbi:MAG TPA: response regulator, partial [Geminicoccus sp.]|uniref:response regulator n=1 Tax=Geminicoccus sp. TaxID=2024832 RepID=UPI002CF38209